MPTLYEREAFLQAWQTVIRRQNWKFTLPVGIVYFSGLLGGMYLIKHYHVPAMMYLWSGYAVLLPTTLTYLFLRYPVRKFFRCPFCRRPITIYKLQLSVFTGRCCHCGEIILTEQTTPEK